MARSFTDEPVSDESVQRITRNAVRPCCTARMT
jgi:hypothetical protein